VREGEAQEVDESVIDELKAQGIISADGTITGEAAAVLNVLKEARSYSRIRILGAMSQVDKVTYFHNNLACSVDSGPSTFDIAMPPSTADALYALEEFTGSSRLVNVEFAAKLSLMGARAFLALVDLTRVRALKILAGEPNELGCTKGEIMARAVSQPQGYMALARNLQDLVEPSLLGAELPVAALDELLGKRMVRREGELFFLQGESLELATNFLLPEYVFSVSYGHVNPPREVVHAECNVVFCGMHNLLYMEATGNDELNLETMSGSALFGMLQRALAEAPVLSS
jgi:hypothetical protein